MELYDEEKRKLEENRNTKINKIIIALIILVIVLIAVLMITIFYLSNNPNKITVNFNGKNNTQLENIIKLKENEDGTISVYAPIKDFAKLVGFESHNGEYLSSSQDSDKCHVITENEVATFYLNSNVINLKRINNNSEIEECDIGEKVFENNGELYTNDTGLEKGMNVSLSYNKKTKTLNIYSLDTMTQLLKTSIVERFKNDGVNGVDEKNYINKKAILDGLVVVTSGDDSTNNTSEIKYGVVDYNAGRIILELKYDEITYIPEKSNFLVKINNKVGIINKNGEEKIRAIYDSLNLIDKEKELYLAQNNGLYGVIDSTGKTVIYLEYNQIGIDASKFEQNGIKSGYILLDKLIPVKQGDKWGFFDKDGKRLTDMIYDNIGCILNSNNGAYSVLTIPEYNLVVVQRDENYTYMDINGNEILSNVLSSVYMRITSGEKVYYMVRDNNEYNVLDALKQRYNQNN